MNDLFPSSGENMERLFTEDSLFIEPEVAVKFMCMHVRVCVCCVHAHVCVNL